MKLSEHFELAEFNCHSGEPVPPSVVAAIQTLVKDVLEPVRQWWGKPIVVISGWRSQFWNDRIGGAKASTHMSGEGADVRPISPSELPAFFSAIEEMRTSDMLKGLGGFGKYLGWAHLDTRKAPDGHLRRWQGTGIGSER